MHLLRNKLVKSDFLAFPYCRPLPKGQWAVAYICTTNYHKLILMQATAERAMGGGFWRNSDSELKLKNRCTGSTYILSGFDLLFIDDGWNRFRVGFGSLVYGILR